MWSYSVHCEMSCLTYCCKFFLSQLLFISNLPVFGNIASFWSIGTLQSRMINLTAFDRSASTLLFLQSSHNLTKEGPSSNLELELILRACPMTPPFLFSSYSRPSSAFKAPFCRSSSCCSTWKLFVIFYSGWLSESSSLTLVSVSIGTTEASASIGCCLTSVLKGLLAPFCWKWIWLNEDGSR